MKIKPLFVTLFAAAMLASCGGNSHATGLSSSTSHATGLTSETSAPSATYLDWVANGKIVIDLFDCDNARFTYGNAALQATNTLDLSASAKIACSSTHTEDQVFNFVYVTEASTETGFNAGAALYAGIMGDKISEFLADNSELAGKARAYVAISFGSTVKWTKGKNAAMDAKIQQLVDASK